MPLKPHQFAIYLHDFGSKIGLCFTIKHPQKIIALIMQNGDIYEYFLEPKYLTLKKYWNDPSPRDYEEIRSAINADALKDEFLNNVNSIIAERISPDLWVYHWGLITDKREDITAKVIAGLR